MIEESTTEAQDFVQKLAGVYRYILQIKDKDLIELRKELDFVESYNFLLAHRYRKNLTVKINIDHKFLQRLIIPAAVQMLIENCVKHNEISLDKPLHVLISCDDDYLTVRNNLQPKVAQEDSEKIGLNNLRKRFAHYTNQEMIIDKTETEFIVKLPMIREID